MTNESLKPKEPQITADQALFLNLIASLSTGILMHLGKIPDPTTQKTAKDLQGARASIDLLQMLQEKTKGNLSKEEEEALGSTVTNLQLLYVQENKTVPEPPKKEEDKKEEANKEPETQKETAQDEDTEKTKFRKTYD